MRNNDEDTDWTDDGSGIWTRTWRGMRLRVTPDPDDPDEPWTWEVLEVADDDVEYEIDMGGAESLEAAKATAEEAARAADEEEDDEE